MRFLELLALHRHARFACVAWHGCAHPRERVAAVPESVALLAFFYIRLDWPALRTCLVRAGLGGMA